MKNGGGEFLKSAALLTAIVAGVIGVILPLYTRNPPVPNQVQDNAENATVAKDKADKALTTADSAFRLALKSGLNKEKVCSEHNQGVACRNLFNRLSRALSQHQRKELACAVLVQLANNKALMLRHGRCPR